MGKRTGRQRDTEFTAFSTEEFRARFYDRRYQLDAKMRQRVEREAKARGLRNTQRRR